MIKYKKIEYEDTDICVLRNHFEVEALLEMFDNREMYESEVKEITSVAKKKDFLSVRYALKICLNGEENNILYTSKGKPFLTSNKHKISISHTRNWVAVITHSKKNVGIDIERPTQKLIAVAEKFLSKSELEQYNQFNEQDRFSFLRIIWSAKEALFKIVGDAYNFSEQLNTLPFELQKEGCIKLIHIDKSKEYCVKYLLTDDYTLAYCIEDE